MASALAAARVATPSRFPVGDVQGKIVHYLLQYDSIAQMFSQMGATTAALELSLPAKSSTKAKFQSAVQSARGTQ